jgi:transcriptional regulator with XRE-family HTH domain
MSIAFPIPGAVSSHNPDMPARPRQRVTIDHNPDLSDLAGRLRHAINLAGSNPNKIEVSTGITRQALYAVLQGKTKALSYPVLRALSKHLGVRPEWLADGRMPMQPAPELKDDDEIQLVQAFRTMFIAAPARLSRHRQSVGRGRREPPRRGSPLFANPRPQAIKILPLV